MKEKKEITAMDSWERLPDILRTMIQCNGITGNHYDEGIIRYLTDQLYKCDRWCFGITPYDVIEWIDYGVAALFPLFFHEDSWVEFLPAIERILDRSNELMKSYFPEDVISGNRTPSDVEHHVNYVRLAQRLLLFKVVLYSFKEDCEEKLQDTLKRLLGYTERNVMEILDMDDEEAMEYATWDDLDDHYDGSTEEYLILDWLAAKEVLPNQKAIKLLLQTYTEYIDFLYDLDEDLCSKKVLNHLKAKADDNFGTIMDVFLMYDEEDENTACFSKSMDKETLSSKKEKKEFQENNISDISIIRDKILIDLQTKNHQVFEDFAVKLTAMLLDNPGLPVIMPTRCFGNKPIPACTIKKIFDNRSGQSQKLIVIFDSLRGTDFELIFDNKTCEYRLIYEEKSVLPF